MEKYYANGITVANSGGLYTVVVDVNDGCPLSGACVSCTAKGVFRHRDERPKVGDRVRISFTDHSFTQNEEGGVTVSETFADVCVCEILERKNTFIRPPVSNIDCIFIVLSARSPKTDTLVADKLISIAEYNKAEPIIVISKSDLDSDAAGELYAIYEKAGFDTFLTSGEDGSGVSELRHKVESVLSEGKVIAFAGASGVGKSTMINKIFPSLGIQTGDVSKKTERGRHTTRAVTLYPAFGGYVADTPGFSMLDFEHFDFFELPDLVHTFRDFEPLLCECRYTDCTHTKEDECGITRALREGGISPSRHASYLNMYQTLKNKPSWKKG
jgi:ribosome biogenesis GTPase